MSAADRIKELTRPTGEEDLLPVRYPEPRLRLELKQAMLAAAAVLAIVCGWAAARLTAEQPPTPEWGQVAAESPVPEKVVVAVVGEVANPGLVTLDQGSRVADALDIAQPLPAADLITLNIAQMLVDGQQIHVQAIGAAPVDAPPAAPGLISLNQASAAELTSLPGVGEATAAAIVAHREANGPFGSVDALLDVKGIGPAKLDAIRDLVAL